MRRLVILALLLVAAPVRAQHVPGTLLTSDLAERLTVAALELAGGSPARSLPELEEVFAAAPLDHLAALDLALALLATGDLDRVQELAATAYSHQDSFAASRYVVACVHLRRGEWRRAIEILDHVSAAAPDVAAVAFQKGYAFEQLGELEDAERWMRETLRLDIRHPVAHHSRAQLLVRLGRRDEARAELAVHRRLLQEMPPRPGDRHTRQSLEVCRLLEPMLPPASTRPHEEMIAVRFERRTEELLGEIASSHRAPLAPIDVGGDGRIDLFATAAAGRDGFSLLVQGEAGFQRAPAPLAASAMLVAAVRRVLVGDLTSDGIADVVVLGESGCKVYSLSREGGVTDATMISGLAAVQASDGVLVDLDHTGTLDLAVTSSERGLELHRNLGAMRFALATGEFCASVASDPGVLRAGRQIAAGDVNGDDLIDLLIGREEDPAALLLNRRQGRFELVTGDAAPATGLPHGGLLVADDLDGDLDLDIAAAGAAAGVTVRVGANATPVASADAAAGATRLLAVDLDSDGWLDLLLAGESGLKAWRNLGGGRFAPATAALGLDRLELGAVADVSVCDLDADGDLDLVVALAGGGLEALVNEGAEAHHSISLSFRGQRSNASGLGVEVEVYAGELRTSRTVVTTPLVIGIGELTRVPVLNVIWGDQTNQVVDVAATDGGVIEVVEPYIETGSCPYLYAWDGERFRFVTDILGVAPLGLPIAPGLLAAADPEEIAWVGSAESVRPRDGYYELRITEELREALYLDEAALLVVDHPAGVETHPTDKLRPPPFEPGEIVPLGRRFPLVRAEGEQGDLTATLAGIDDLMASPPEIQGDHLRGMARPHAITLDFGALPPPGEGAPLVLALTGWLRYGGATGNIAAAFHPGLEPPTPVLLAETAPGEWQPLDVVVGLPAGKTKTILVDLEGALPPGARRLRLQLGFEVHWDRIALFERARDGDLQVRRLEPARAVLRPHGYGAIVPASRDRPVTSDYHRLRPAPPWRYTPAGDYTRFGDVMELVERRDDRLVVLGGGDEVALSFDVSALAPPPPGWTRELFLLSVGWDKDADPHCVAGLTVLPLPFHGMDDQRYGEEARPAHLPDDWIERYNTRRVEAEVPGTRPGMPQGVSR